jgi:hypothetical protein
MRTVFPMVVLLEKNKTGPMSSGSLRGVAEETGLADNIQGEPVSM